MTAPKPSERNPIKAIRRHCLECSGGSHLAAEECTSANCALFLFRIGKNPFRPSTTERDKMRILGATRPLGVQSYA